MPKTSAGLLMFRTAGAVLEVLLVHPGGPLWTRKDAGAWFVPKGELNADEDALTAAQREFTEETGAMPAGPFISLGEVRHKSGKRVIAWAFHGDWDPSGLESNSFSMEWPPKSGRYENFPEVDRAMFMTLPVARTKIHPAERAFLDRLEQHLAL